MDFDIVNEPLGNDKAGKPVYLRDIWPTPQEVESTMRSSVTSEMFRKEYADVFTGDAHWQALPIPEGDLYAWDGKSTYIKDPPYFEGMPPKPGRAFRFARLAGARSSRRQHHHRSHLSSRIDPRRKPGGKISDRQRRPAQGLQFLWRAPRQPRSDDARHVRQHPPEKPARARHRRRLDDSPAQRRENVHLRRGHEISRRARAADDPGRQRIWLRFVARLGGEGNDSSRRARGAGRELRAHSSQQPGGNGRAACRVSAGRKREISGANGPGGFRFRGPGAEFRAAQENQSNRPRYKAARRKPSPLSRASIRPSKWPTTSTAEFCNTSCARCCSHIL